MILKKIDITEVGNFRIGQIEDTSAATGVTVIVAENGAPCGLDVRGGGPASRESELLKPLAAADIIHAVVLGGGSAFGLDAAGGVMENLEKRGIGFPVGEAVVPLVCQSDIFDLMIGKATTRPTKEMGYTAAEAAFLGKSGNYRDGNYGCGCGATVGKLMGMERSMKSGIGSHAVELGDLKVGAIVSVNALGDVYDYETNKKLAGLLSEDKSAMIDSEELMYEMASAPSGSCTANTTIGIILTNAKFDKSKLCKIAAMGHDGYARSIRPIHTTMDGDSIYAMSVGDVDASIDLVGTLANKVMCEAIRVAVNSAETLCGITALRDL